MDTTRRSRLGEGRVRIARFVLLLMLAVFGAAYAAGAAYSSSFDWVANVTFGGGAAVGTEGWAARSYIEIWRTPVSACTVEWYEHTDGSLNVGPENCTANPFTWNQGDSYGKAFCHNVESYEVSPYTCQTTS